MKLSQDKLDHISKLASEVAERENCVLYDLESVGQGKGKILRVFIDRHEGGVSHDDCANVSRGLGLLLDVDGAMEEIGPYSLEVSSPGLERHLRTSKHYEAAVDKEVSLQLNRSLGELVSGLPSSLVGHKKMKVKLKEVSNSMVRVELIGKNQIEVELPLSEIKKGRLVYDFKNERVRKR